MSDDPWVWTVDDLVIKLCHSKQIFEAAGCDVTGIPDATALENYLRTQQVAGATLLNALCSPAIRDSLAVFTLKQRLEMLNVIEYLQRQSLLYKHHDATTGVQSLNIGGKRRISDSSSTLATDTAINTVAKERKRQKLIYVDNLPHSLLSQHLQQDMNETGAWDHLLRWEQMDNSEDLADSDVWEEEQEEEQEEDDVDIEDARGFEHASHDQNKMNPDQVANIINERIEFYTNSWNIGKEKDTTYDAVEFWNKANAAGRREQLVQMYENDVAYYGQRLDKLCNEIVDGYTTSGGSVATVRLQCRNLETTVELMELSGWLRDLYQRESAEESEEELDSNASFQPRTVEATPLSQRPQTWTGIVDLGSPSESSDSDPVSDASVRISTSPNPCADRRPLSPYHRVHTLDSVIAETIEPLSYTYSEIRLRPQAKTSLEISATASFFSPRVHGDEPEHSSIRTVRNWEWTDLIDQQDRKRIVLKAMLEMKYDDREIVRTRLKFVGKTNMVKEIHACVAMLVAKETRMQGVLPRDLTKIMVVTKLFLCWWMCHRHSKEELSVWHLEELAKLLEEGQIPDPGVFCGYLATIMTTTFSVEALKHPERPSQKEVINLISDDEDDMPSQPAPQCRSKETKSPNLRHEFPSVLD